MVRSVDQVLHTAVMSSRIHSLLIIRIDGFFDHMAWNFELVCQWLVESRQVVLVLYHFLCVDCHRARLYGLTLM